MADGINRRYFPDRLVGVSALDPYDLVDKIGIVFSVFVTEGF